MESASIMKLLEEDEDENLHSGADVEAFTAALNRDIGGGGGGDTLVSQSIDSDAGVSSLGSNPTSDQLIGQWQASSQEESLACQDQKQEQQHDSLPQQHSSETEAMPHGPIAENQNQEDGLPLENEKLPSQYNKSQDDQQHQQTEQNTIQLSDKNQVQVSEKDSVQHPEQDRMNQSGNQHQHPNPPQLSNQQTPVADPRNNSARRIPFYSILPILRPHLDKDRAMQLEAIFGKLRKNEVDKEDFLRVVRNIVGDKMLRMAAQRIQIQQRAQAQATGTSEMAPHQYQLQSQASLQQLHLPSSSAQQLTETQPHLQHHSTSSNQHQKGPGAPTHTSQFPVSTAPGQVVPGKENLGEMSMEAEHRSDSQMTHVSPNMSIVKRERETPMVSATAVNKQQQQQLHIPPTPFPMYGGAIGNYNTHAYSGPSASVAASSIQAQDPQIRPVSNLQTGMVSSQLAPSLSKNPMNSPRYELRSRMNENKRVQGGPLTQVPSQSTMLQSSVAWQSSLNNDPKSSALTPLVYPKQEPVDHMSKQQHNPRLSAPHSSSSFGLHIDQGSSSVGPSKEEGNEKQSARMGFSTAPVMMAANQMSGPVSAQQDSSMQMRSPMASAATPVGAGTNARTPPKKPPVGQKRPMEAAGNLSPISSKKQKVSGAPSDQSIEHLNDVTAVSGVNLREEEEQLLSAPKEDSRASEATRRVVQEEEDRLILQRGPLQKKIAEIISKCGLKSKSNDVERCLSMCVEERLRGLISSLIRMSKQRVDIEKPRHRILITSDVRRQILMMNRKAKEDWEKKQAEEAEKLRKNNDTEGSSGVDADKDRDEGRSKATKANKEEDDKMRTTAANVAARAAVGGDDMLSKWQLMAEQARQKREGGHDGTSSAIPAKDLSHRPLSTSGKTSRDNQEADNKGPSVAATASGAMRKFGRNLAVIPQHCSRIIRFIGIRTFGDTYLS
ncbi:hypothetical protein MRB53_028798 [Persea americana]|uniref:Uncharacterized protein n=1 Tax=Persea americana TaxID=3435 RepID=A0ACC2KGJ3_PERAE|nr:hypothetical protein MRB53_028798 [Persea americana]